ncbi:MAG: ATP-binding protein [Ignavibacteriae bacterium]|nr:ATP-binding protein [Ignavibacteriota bacterium]
MIYFKELEIEGFKGFSNKTTISLKVPDGKTQGSGLNVFVGPNGTGKTSVLQAIEFLTVNSFSGQSRISSEDFNAIDENKPIKIIGRLAEVFHYPMPSPWKQTLDIREFVVEIKNRDRKAPNKLLSSKYTISNILEPTSRKPSWWNKDDEITDWFLGFDQERMPSDESINIFFFGTNRIKQSKKGFATTFSRVMDDLNWRFLKDVENEKEIHDKWRAYYSSVSKTKAGTQILKVLKDDFGIKDFPNVEVELLNLREPFSEAFFGVASETNLSQIPLSELGTGVEMLYSILFLRQIANQSKGTIIYCIDEPEISLHPQWQKVLFRLLLEEAKTKQVFLSTHSLHFINPNYLGNLKMFNVRNGNIDIRELSIEQSSSFEVKKLLALENREIFFTNQVVLVEGLKDRYRMRNFLNDELTDFFVINGLKNLETLRSLCKQLCIEFRAIVDLDYLGNFSDLLPTLTENESKELDECKNIKELLEGFRLNEKLRKILERTQHKITTNVNKALASKIYLQSKNNKSYKNEIEKIIKELAKERIFILREGMIEDYLDDDGKSQSPDKKQELLRLLS